MEQMDLFDELVPQDQEEYILISLKPQFYQWILEGAKKHEFRKRFPNRKVNAFIYVTKPVGAIKALFEFDAPIVNPNDLVGQEGMGVQEFMSGEMRGEVAVPIRRIRLLKKDVDLTTLQRVFNRVAPQSYYYLHHDFRLLNYLLSLI